MPGRTDTARAHMAAASTASHAAGRAAEVTLRHVEIGRGSKTAEGTYRGRRRAQGPRLPTDLKAMMTMIRATASGTLTMRGERHSGWPKLAGISARTIKAQVTARKNTRARAEPGRVSHHVGRRRAGRREEEREGGPLLARETMTSAGARRDAINTARLTGPLTLQNGPPSNTIMGVGSRYRATHARRRDPSRRSFAELQLKIMRRRAPPQVRSQRSNPRGLVADGSTRHLPRSTTPAGLYRRRSLLVCALCLGGYLQILGRRGREARLKPPPNVRLCF